MELREALAHEDDLVVLFVLAEGQINDKTRRFVDETGLRQRVRFLADPEPMEVGVPHPTTYLIDREGRIRFVDVREDFHIWLDPDLVVQELTTFH